MNSKNIQYAKDVVIHELQTREYKLEFECLENKAKVKSGSRAERRLNLKTASSLIGQLGLYAEKARKICAHYGVEYVVTYLCQKYWIPRMRQTVKSVLEKCVTCKKYQGRPYDLGLGLPPYPIIE